MQTVGVLGLVLLCVLETRGVYGETFEFPTSHSTTVAQYSTNSATSTCASGDQNNCTSGCPYRNTFPTKITPLKNLPENCTEMTSSDRPSAAIATNGNAKFDDTTNGCVIEDTVSSANPNNFTVSVWIEVACASTCDILRIGQSGPQLSYTSLEGKLHLDSTYAIILASSWYLVVIRYNGVLSWFVNSNKQTDVLFTGSASQTIKLGPENILTGSDTINMVDARLYSDSLTDREVNALYDGTFQVINPMSGCRCPVTHPTLVQKTLPVQYMKCKNGKNQEVLRLGTNVHIPEYMTDEDTSTSWVSVKGQSSNVILTLKNQFQIKQITVKGIKHTPISLQIIFFIGIKENRVYNFKSSCGRSTEHCELLNLKLSGESFSYNFEPNTTIKRSVYQQMLADKVVVQATFSPNNYFTVSELKLDARCNCFGQDHDCSISQGTYTCTCDPSTKTTSDHCDQCVSEFFRLSDYFKCTNPCNCNTTGRVNNTCSQVDGQCHCHGNIEGRQCSQCKHNSAKFSSNGCEACSCNAGGITSCSDDLTCNCKQNVETSTGNCASCIPNYYNITKPSGCTSCDCNAFGTMDLEYNCDNNTGQCECRSNVQGRKCNTCIDKYFGLSAENESGCGNCSCNIVGSESLICDKGTGQCLCVDGKDQHDDPNRQCIPRRLKLEPNFGPMAGGTELTLTGTLLGSNADVSLTLGGVKQTVVSGNLTLMIFKTKQAGSVGEKTLSLTWTDQGETYSDKDIERETASFTYKTNPQLIAPTESIWSFSSGGCTLRLTGSNLDSVAYPKMRVYLKDGFEAKSVCFSPEQDELKCQTPAMTDKINATLLYGIELDGVTGYENVSKFGSMVIVVADPIVYLSNSETFRNTFDKVFSVKGERMNVACNDSDDDDDDVTISLGDTNCVLLSRSNDLITCDPGESFPGTARTVQVKVKIGNKEFPWGELKINSFWTNTEFIGIAVGAGVFLVAIIVIIICIIRCRKSSNDHADDDIPLEIPHPNGRRDPNNYTSLNPVAFVQPQQNQAETKTPKEINEAFCSRLKKHIGKVVSTSLIERCNIETGKICTNKGKKSRVISGHYNASTSSPYSGSTLTIKTLLESYPEEGDLPDWLNTNLLECTRLQDFDNDNVLRMKGIAVDAKNIYIIYPEMSNKTLKDYLIGTNQGLDMERRLEICTQVAEGMNYLSTQGVVHKDLAARNCWVSHDFEVKISDASFSFDLYPDDYLESNGRYQPIRWMAPESLRQGFYDTKTDVWSYGVLVWEVFTHGHMPFIEIRRNEEVKRKVCDDEYRLTKPPDCSDAIFHVISACHTGSSEDRPNFFIVQNMLDNVINPHDSPTDLYVNQGGLAAGEDGMEDYENLTIKPPPRPPKGRRP